jgi:DNA recombination protein RmuC
MRVAIGEEAKELVKRFGLFSDHLEKVGKELQSATAAYNDAVGSWNRRLLPGARATAKLVDAQSPEIEDIASVRDVPRSDISGRSTPGPALE